MTSRRARRLGPPILLMALASISVLRAEGSVDFHVGRLFPGDADISDVDISSSDPNIASTKDGTLRDVEIEEAFTVGLRLTYWSERWPLIGFDFDGFVWNFEISDQTVRSDDGETVALSEDTDLLDEGDFGAFMMTVRVLLRARFGESENLPEGRVQIYGGVGPALYTPSFAILLALVSIGVDTGDAFGLDGVAGLRAVSGERTAFFLEYRRTSLPDFEFFDRDEGELDFTSATVQAGLSIRL